jgi:hypothetical protein
VRWGCPVMPSHQDVAVTGQRDIREDRVAVFDGAHRVRTGVIAGARGDAEEPELRVTAYSQPSGPNRVQAMSSPIVSAVQPGRVGCEVGLAKPDRLLGDIQQDYRGRRSRSPDASLTAGCGRYPRPRRGRPAG